MVKFLEITVKQLQHLPKMDMMGSCDPFCRLLFCESQQETKHQNNTYDASWTEPLIFEIPQRRVTALSVEVLDKNSLMSDKTVGKVIVSETDMQSIVSQDPNLETESLYEVKADGVKSVVGYDKYTTTILLSFKVLEKIKPAAVAAAAPAATKKAVEVKVISVRNMPKMDTVGSCDPFCRVEFCDALEETSVVSNQYDADWNQSFMFPLPNSGAPTALVFTVLDFDRLGEAEVVGQVLFPASEMAAVAERADNWQEEYTAVLFAHDGGSVLGEVYRRRRPPHPPSLSLSLS
jgi:Ca2+-dependent lipid-binding protein